ncbi:Ig-like domain-containing protein [Candidatus Peregrinibacteria bacterium]|nr:MAG: Ig-like domain-containing protein [Candidatus Peregrinibacteria bacterium]
MNQASKSFPSFVASWSFWALLMVSLALFFVVGLFYALLPRPDLDPGYFIDEVNSISVDTPFTFHFTQPMRTGSVEDVVLFFPHVEGDFEWMDARTLTFIPQEPLAIHDQVLVEFGPLSSRYFKSMPANRQLRFVVTGPPQVRFFYPIPQADALCEPDCALEIAPDQALTVMFDRAMVAFDQLFLPLADSFSVLSIDPPVEGEARWIGTRTLQFVPSSWPMATHFTVTIPQGVPALDGSFLDASVMYELSTPAPEVVETFPEPGAPYFSTDGDLIVRFNQPIRLDDIRPGDNVQLFPSNDLDANQRPRRDGFFNTDIHYGTLPDGSVDRRTLVFSPSIPYQHDTDYELVLSSGIISDAFQEGVYGTRLLNQDYRLSFHTVSSAGISNLQFQSNPQTSNDQSIDITFTSPVTLSSISPQLILDPPAASPPELTVSEDGLTVKAVYPLAPNQAYHFQVKAPFRDAYDQIANQGAEINFVSAPLPSEMTLEGDSLYTLFPLGTAPKFSVQMANLSSIQLSVCPLSLNDFYRHSADLSWARFRCSYPDTQIVHLPDITDTRFDRTFDLSRLFNHVYKEGLYFVHFSSPQFREENTVRIFW